MIFIALENNFKIIYKDSTNQKFEIDKIEEVNKLIKNARFTKLQDKLVKHTWQGVIYKSRFEDSHLIMFWLAHKMEKMPKWYYPRNFQSLHPNVEN